MVSPGLFCDAVCSANGPDQLLKCGEWKPAGAAQTSAGCSEQLEDSELSKGWNVFWIPNVQFGSHRRQPR